MVDRGRSQEKPDYRARGPHLRTPHVGLLLEPSAGAADDALPRTGKRLFGFAREGGIREDRIPLWLWLWLWLALVQSDGFGFAIGLSAEFGFAFVIARIRP